MTVLDRFLRYVRYDTQSDETSSTFPSTAKQLVLLRYLAAELRELGAADAAVDDYGYVMATIPATAGCSGIPRSRTDRFALLSHPTRRSAGAPSTSTSRGSAPPGRTPSTAAAAAKSRARASRPTP